MDPIHSLSKNWVPSERAKDIWKAGHDIMRGIWVPYIENQKFTAKKQVADRTLYMYENLGTFKACIGYLKSRACPYARYMGTLS